MMSFYLRFSKIFLVTVVSFKLLVVDNICSRAKLARVSIDRNKRIVNNTWRQKSPPIFTKAWNDGRYIKDLFLKHVIKIRYRLMFFLRRGSCPTVKPDLLIAFSYVRFLNDTFREISNT